MLAKLSPASVAMGQRWADGRVLIDTAVMRLAVQCTVRGDAEVDIVAGCCSRGLGQ